MQYYAYEWQQVRSCTYVYTDLYAALSIKHKPYIRKLTNAILYNVNTDAKFKLGFW